MASAFMNLLRLGKAGIVLAQYGVRFVPKGMKVPFVLHLAQAVTWPVKMLTIPFRMGESKGKRVGNALNRLGPSYIKLGQFLATRGDVIGLDLAADLGHLQDKLPPFSMSQARQAVTEALGGKLEDHFSQFSPPIAAASIAQVHKAVTVEPASGANEQARPVASIPDTLGIGESHIGEHNVSKNVGTGLSDDIEAFRLHGDVAVKILRPGIEKRFKHDLDSYYFAASMIERFHPPSRRLKPIAVVNTLKRTTELEMDLRLEAAAMSEMAQNIASDGDNIRVPKVDWQRTTKRILTLEWIEGTPISDHAALRAQGVDLKALGMTVLRSFLTHAMRDGFFHADMHQGNLLVDADGRLVVIDFGIMGRLGFKERRFLAEILHGLITRNYLRASQAHFDAGYVPPHHSVEIFAQALRAIGEPIHGRTAEEISMADLLGQLFAYTDVFDMDTQPELIMLQKSMVIVEGVARSLDPGLNLWGAAEPVARQWMETNLGPLGAMKDAREGASDMGRFMAGLPGVLAQAETTSQALAEMARGGIQLNDETISRMAREQARHGRMERAALWLVAVSLAALAISQWLG